MEDVTNLIEKLELFEERAGIRIEAMSAFVEKKSSDPYRSIQVHGEIYPSQGIELNNDVLIKMMVYDSMGRMVKTSEELYKANDFYGFEAISIWDYIPQVNISKIRIIPKIINEE